MMLAFTLSMPGCPSWNGKWSGEGKKYVIINTYVGKKHIEHAEKILRQRSFSYRWDDGWAARIDVHEVSSSQAAKLRKESNGFCGYDWMVKSIVQHGVILADHQVEEFLKKRDEAKKMETGLATVRAQANEAGQRFDEDDNFFF